VVIAPPRHAPCKQLFCTLLEQRVGSAVSQNKSAQPCFWPLLEAIDAEAIDVVATDAATDVANEGSCNRDDLAGA
jgi:hypothetical protein